MLNFRWESYVKNNGKVLYFYSNKLKLIVGHCQKALDYADFV